MPSHTIATIYPASCNFFISSALFSGKTSARIFSIHSCFPMASAVLLLSHVIIKILIPSFFNRSTASREVDFIVSATAINHIIFESLAKSMTVFHSFSNCSITSVFCISILFFCMSFLVPRKYCFPFIIPSIHFPGTASKFSIG